MSNKPTSSTPGFVFGAPRANSTPLFTSASGFVFTANSNTSATFLASPPTESRMSTRATAENGAPVVDTNQHQQAPGPPSQLLEMLSGGSQTEAPGDRGNTGGVQNAARPNTSTQSTSMPSQTRPQPNQRGSSDGVQSAQSVGGSNTVAQQPTSGSNRKTPTVKENQASREPPAPTNQAASQADEASPSGNKTGGTPGGPSGNGAPGRGRKKQTGDSSGKFHGIPNPCQGEEQPLFDNFEVTDLARDETSGTFTYHFEIDAHVRSLVRALHFLQLKRWYTDTVLISEDKREPFHFHGVLLASASTMFQNLFANSQMNFYRGTLHPKGATSAILQSLFDYMYKPALFAELLADGPPAMDFFEQFELTSAFLESHFEPGAILENFNELFETRTITYTIFKVEDEEFPCHAAIVAAVAPGLLAPEENGAPDYESYEPIILEDCHPRTVEQLLNFAYTGKIQLSEEYALDALANFCKWKVPALVRVVCDFLKSVMTPDNATDVYLNSQEIFKKTKNADCASLHGSTIQFFKDNVKEVVKSANFLAKINEEQYRALLLLVLVQGVITKEELVTAILEWYKEGEMVGQDRQAAMCRLLSVVTIVHDGPRLGKSLEVFGKSYRTQFPRLEPIAKALGMKK